MVAIEQSMVPRWHGRDARRSSRTPEDAHRSPRARAAPRVRRTPPGRRSPAAHRPPRGRRPPDARRPLRESSTAASSSTADAHRSGLASRRCRAIVAAREAWIAAARVSRASASTSTLPSCAQAWRAWLSTSLMDRAARPVFRAVTSSPARRVRADSAARARARRSSRDCSGTATPRSSPPADRARSACRAEAAASSSSRIFRPYRGPPTRRAPTAPCRMLPGRLVGPDPEATGPQRLNCAGGGRARS